MMTRPAFSQSRLDRRVTLRDIQILLAVAERGSMAKAASHLSITQPAVSQAVANLERAFGARLIDRGPHGAVLTSYGEVIQRRGVEVFDVLQQGFRETLRICRMVLPAMCGSAPMKCCSAALSPR